MIRRGRGSKAVGGPPRRGRLEPCSPIRCSLTVSHLLIKAREILSNGRQMGVSKTKRTYMWHLQLPFKSLAEAYSDRRLEPLFASRVHAESARKESSRIRTASARANADKMAAAD